MRLNNIKLLRNKAFEVRNRVLDILYQAGSGHIAPSFSCIDILTALYYGKILNIKPHNPRFKGRDRFILSKGHASIALYVILADLGFFPASELNRFCKPQGILGTHAENFIPGIEVSTGSLGHGLSIGAGLALAAKINKAKYLSVVLMGDGECHEGSVWEAAMFASQHKLDNLIAIIDYNKFSAIGILRDYLDVEPFQAKWESFGWDVKKVNGHSFKCLLPILGRLRKRASGRPLAIIASTVKGKGLSFMENNPIWHYRVPDPEELNIARRELQSRK